MSATRRLQGRRGVLQRRVQAGPEGDGRRAQGRQAPPPRPAAQRVPASAGRGERAGGDDAPAADRRGGPCRRDTVRHALLASHGHSASELPLGSRSRIIHAVAGGRCARGLCKKILPSLTRMVGIFRGLRASCSDGEDAGASWALHDHAVGCKSQRINPIQAHGNGRLFYFEGK